jgi:rhodanese-related sulfurtransferase
MTRISMITVACGFLCAAMSLAASAQEHTKDSLDMVKRSVDDKKAVLLDCREKSEWDAGHLKVARFLALSTISSKDKVEEFTKNLPKDQIIYVHCASGKRCVTAAGVLQKLGYDARPLKEGFKDLLKAGFTQADK